MSSEENTVMSSHGDSERLVTRHNLGREKGNGSSHFLRIKIPNGLLTSEQFKAIADMSKKYGGSYAEITNRQAIQLHWIDPDDKSAIFSELERINLTTDHGGQGILGARGGDVRGITGCPLAGVDKLELIDASAIVKQLDAYFHGNKDFSDLPRKFKISVSGCQLNCSNPEIQDLSFVAVKHPSGKVGFVVFVGGTIAANPKLARPLDVFVEPDEVLAVAKCMVELFRDFGRRENKATARFRWLVDAWGTEKLRKKVEEKLDKPLETHKLAHLPTHLGEHVGVQPQKQEGYSYVSVPVLTGRLMSDKMLKLAQIVDDYGNGQLRLSTSQNIILVNIPDGSVDVVLKKLEETGFSLAVSPIVWTTIACAGTFCGKPLDPPKDRAVEVLAHLEKRFGDTVRNLKLNINFSGCLNGCGRHLIADIGLQGVQLSVENKLVPGYNMYVRGNGLSDDVGVGKLIQKGIRADHIETAIGNLVKAYLGNVSAKSFTEFCKTHTIEELQAFLS